MWGRRWGREGWGEEEGRGRRKRGVSGAEGKLVPQQVAAV